MQITATYVPTETDVVHGIVAFRRGMFRGLTVGGATCTGLGVLLLVWRMAAGAFTWWPFIFLGFGLAMLALRFFAPIQAARANKHMHGDVCEVTLDDNGYRAVMGGSRDEIPWRTFRKVRRVDDQWVFEVGPTQAVMVPARVFTDEENAELAEFLKTRPRR